MTKGITPDPMLNQEMREAAGDVQTGDPLVSLLYTLMRDHLPAGTVQQLVDEEVTIFNNNGGKPVIHLTNGWLAQHAEFLAKRLLGCKKE